MATRSAARKLTLLPPGAAPFLRRRAGELTGAAALAGAALWALMLASYHALDPSWSAATSEPTRNWLGAGGAHLADLMLQTLGLAAVLPVLVLAAWGWRLVSHRGINRPWLRFAALPLALVATAGLAGSVATPITWPFATGLGGLAGDYVLAWAAAALAHAGLAALPWALGLGFGVGAAATLFVALAIGLGEWRGIGRSLAWGAKATARVADTGWHGLAAAGRWSTRLRRRRPKEIPAYRPVPQEAVPEAEPPKRRVGKRAGQSRRSKRAEAEDQNSLDLGPTGDFRLPELGLLNLPPETAPSAVANDDALEQNARILETVLDDYGVRGRIVEVRPGPVVTLYELEPAPGTKTNRVIGLADDIARSMSALSVRVAVVPGRNAIGIELPNQSRETVYLRDLLATKAFDEPGVLTLALGKDISGAPVLADLGKMPHLLIAGTTGSGKSVAINTMILSLLYRMSPEHCRLIMIDPKMLELSVYDDIPHLLTPVVTDPGKAVVALKWTVREMEDRYKAMARLGVRNIHGYNQRLAEAKAAGEEITRTVQTGFDETGAPVFEAQTLDLEPMPFIVVVVDEMADLMMVAGKDIEGAIQRLAQMARAAGIHLIMATQRPSVDVITGTIKANFPTRVSFQVTSKIDSRTILGEQGAEQLLGHGDMLYMAGGGRIVRVHGPFVSDAEVERVVGWLKRQGMPEYLDAVTEDDDGGFEGSLYGAEMDSGDLLYDRAVDLVSQHQKASTSFIQRHLQIGYNRAARLVERMEEENIIGPANHVGKREIFVRRPDDDY
ncbi:MAG: DNA translocase FtsK 4TM domain-containing protein [Alphaproteobacteria bacterium]|nr:DNA translocase FtsK 4TM domain-containing protein [Alphaproteobacteria bacterium]